MVYIAGLDVHDLLARSPVSHAKGVESIVWLTTFAGAYRGLRGHRSRRHKHHAKHRSSSASADTGVAKPPGNAGNIGEKPPAPLLVRLLGPPVHALIIAGPAVYLIGTAFEGMEQPEWFSEWSLPYPDLDVGKFAMLRTFACVANYATLYLLRRVRKHIQAAVRTALLPSVV